ncbi:MULTISPECIES: L,D-transpeptidase family protein [unclassified Luteococcus]|uniref:L,D-transpeptidase family protein n=1 Tax=unclassified Luteococcus TaxID=2639923 RepID=UPI00313BC7A4
MSHKISRALVAAAAAAALVTTPALTAPAHAAPLPAADTVIAKTGTRSKTVQQIQGRLNGLGYLPVSAITGYYGTKTTAAVKRFQANNGLKATGVVNTTTNNLIIAKYKARKAPKPASKPAPKPATGSKIVARPGDKNKTVQQIQGRLNGLGYLAVSDIIGIYGPKTTAAVKRFQANNGLKATGIVDVTTNNLIIAKYKSRKASKPAPKPATGSKIVARPGDKNKTVQQIQGRLNGLGYLAVSDIIGIYGPKTTAAVKRFQANNGLKATGIVDVTTNNRIIAKYKTRKPVTRPSVRLDSRCLTGRAICIDKGDQKMYWVINGKVQASYKVRTGRPSLPTRSGSFHVYLKHPNWYSTLYHVNMPYTMFFSGGQAVHYSSEFARIGYSGAGSHGCVNMNSRSDARWLYNQVRVGDKVIVTS